MRRVGRYDLDMFCVSRLLGIHIFAGLADIPDMTHRRYESSCRETLESEAEAETEIVDALVVLGETAVRDVVDE